MKNQKYYSLDVNDQDISSYVLIVDINSSPREIVRNFLREDANNRCSVELYGTLEKGFVYEVKIHGIAHTALQLHVSNDGFLKIIKSYGKDASIREISEQDAVS
ncbi:MAG TPA: hypothetical protein VI815_01990 [Candidatus Nanoarchaeia archaeon]|nr:hypothetical protein [Candidatus Nanoarchaeia archaeon]